MQANALIFDCDGTLVDSMPPHYEAWVATLRPYKLSLTEDRFYALGGWPTERVAELLVRESGRDLDVQRLTREKEEAFLRRLDLVRPIDPVVAIVRQFSGRLPMAVATGGLRRVAERLLRQAGLFDCFDAVVTCEDVPRHKPAPDIFLEAARRLNVAPRHCQVYEDTDPGLEAARRAGMECIDVRTFYTPRRVSA